MFCRLHGCGVTRPQGRLLGKAFPLLEGLGVEENRRVAAGREAPKK